MLEALLRNKIERWLTKEKNPWQIEDLLTSVIFGSCKYMELEGWRVALSPFLGAAVLAESPGGRNLREHLPDRDTIVAIEYDIWPSWGALQIPATEGEPEAVSVDGGEPDVFVRLTTRHGRKIWLLVEVKLTAGKSSGPSSNKGQVSDQLAKYWMQMKSKALEANAEPLALVYLTPGISCPFDEIEQSRNELQTKTSEKHPPMYWLSWRRFVSEVEQTGPVGHLPSLLQDLITLLRDKWCFSYEEIGRWPDLCSIVPSSSGFEERFGWRSLPLLELSLTTVCTLCSLPSLESAPLPPFSIEVVWDSTHVNLPEWILADS